MSEFFKALEQAEQDRARGRSSGAREMEADGAAPPSSVEPIKRSPAVATPVVEESAALPVSRPASPHQSLRTEIQPDVAERTAGVDERMVSLVTPNTFEAEQYRTLRHMIEQLHASAGVSIIACTSPAGGDGKTTTAINMAGAFAQAAEAKVLLVDADLRLSCIARELALSDDVGPGLVGAIVNRHLALDDVVRRQASFALSILPAGSTVANPYELLQSPRFAELMEEARQRYDYVVLDTPPVVGIPDCRAIARSVDGFLIVVAAHRTHRKLVEEALNSIEPAKIIGLIFNGDERPLSGYYYGGAVRSSGPTRAEGRLQKTGGLFRGRLRLRRHRAPD